MSFLFPGFLFALAAIAIPVIIHLFQFRRFKKVYFPNITFLEQLTDESRKQSRLRHLLVLLARILAIVSLVLAFARPYIPRSGNDLLAGGNVISIFIDNSYSMEAGSSTIPLLEQARQGAREIAASFGPVDQFQLLTNDFEARHQRFLNRDEFLDLVGEVDFSPAVRETGEIMKRQTELLNSQPASQHKWAFLLSDFQKNIHKTDNFTPDSLIDYLLLPYQAARNINLFVDSVWIDNPVRIPGRMIQVHARIRNDSDQNFENQPARLLINNAQRAVATYDIKPNAQTSITFNFTISNETHQRGIIEITDHPVTFDDRCYFSFNTSKNIPVLVICPTGGNRYLNALLGGDTTFILRNMQVLSVDYSAFSAQNMVILAGVESPGAGLALELVRYVQQGGSLMVFPPANANLNAYNNLLLGLNVSAVSKIDTTDSRVIWFNYEHPLYSGVFSRLPENIDLPATEQHYAFERRSASVEQVIMRLQNGNTFFSVTPSGQGLVYLSAVPASAEFSNFTLNPIFVPTIYNAVLQSSAYYPLFYTISQDELITIRNYQPGAGVLFRITDSQTDIIPESRTLHNQVNIILHGQVSRHGHYALLAGQDTLRFVAYNYDRRESLLSCYTPDELGKMVSGTDMKQVQIFEPGKISIDKKLEFLKGGHHLWKLFLLLALFFLVAEVILLRLLKDG